MTTFCLIRQCGDDFTVIHAPDEPALLALTASLGHALVGHHSSPRTRAELQNMPLFDRLCGPMWGGLDEAGGAIVRYEDATAYASLSA